MAWEGSTAKMQVLFSIPCCYIAFQFIHIILILVKDRYGDEDEGSSSESSDEEDNTAVKKISSYGFT